MFYFRPLSAPEAPGSRSQDIVLPPIDQPASYSDPLSSYMDPLSPYSDSPFPSSSDTTEEEQPKPRKRKRVNKYGDEIEE